MDKRKLAICIPTYNRPDIIEELLKKSMETYSKFNFDLYIYDSSDNNKTQLITNEWQVKFYNLYYVSIDPEMHSNIKVYKIFQQYGLRNKYDYIWVCGDAIRWSIKVVQKIADSINNNYDIISLNYRDEEKIGDKEYTDKNEIFHELAWHFTLYGAVVLNTNTILNDVNWEVMVEKYDKPDSVNFSHVGFYFEKLCEMDSIKVMNFSFSKYVLTSSILKEVSGWTQEVFFVWGVAWPNLINALPECYTDKAEVIRKNGIYSKVLNIEAFISYRRADIINLRTYLKYKEIWEKVTYVSKIKILSISITPIIVINMFLKTLINIKSIKQSKIIRKFCKKYKEIYIYGAGRIAMNYDKLFKRLHLEYKGFVVSESNENSESFLEHPVIELDELDNKKGEVGIIIALNSLNYDAVRPKLEKMNIMDAVYYSFNNKS